VLEPAATHHPSAHDVARSDEYERRRPEESVLYQTIAVRWPAARERMEERGGQPQFGRLFDKLRVASRAELAALIARNDVLSGNGGVIEGYPWS